MSPTVYAIVSLLASSCAGPRWRLYKKQPKDARRRYATTDTGDDQRTEVISNAALSLWNSPNTFMSGYEFREGCNQHLELTGETFWVVNRESSFNMPTSLWYVRPGRMEPVTDPDKFQIGWMYTGPDGSQIPLQMDEVIQEKTPDPEDPFRGIGPVASIMPNIQQQRYATEYQRNLFVNGSDPGGVIQLPSGVSFTDRDFDEFTNRWRESHQGVARAGRVGILENGAQWVAAGQSNKDMDYANLRLNNRDELREAWRMHKSLLGTVEDVNRANAQTAEETFSTWQQLPRLDRRKDTLNFKFLPMFGDDSVEFDYDDPSPVNAEAANAELLVKAQACDAFINAGFDPHDVLEAVGLPDMAVVEKATQQPALPPGWVPAPPATPAESAPDSATSGSDSTTMEARLRRVLNDGYVPFETARRG
jgi:HK97 family phage portal protein